jgi:hypothetical protein
MDGDRSRRAGAVALVAIVSSAMLIVGAGPAVAAKRGAAGTYTATFPSTSTTSTLVITNAAGSTTSGTFKLTDLGDYGTWVAQGTTLGFVIAQSASGHTGAVMIGKLTASGINPGAFGQPGAGSRAWSATRTSAGSGTTATVTVAASHSNAARVAAKGTVYQAFFTGTVTDTLILSKDGTSKVDGTFTLSMLADGGSWAKLGKKIVLGVTTGLDAGIVLVGTQNASGISSAGAPGAYYQPSAGMHTWYATKG